MEIDVSNFISSFLISLGKVDPNRSRFGMWDDQDTIILRSCCFLDFFYSGKCNRSNCLLLFDIEGENCVTSCLKLSQGTIVVNLHYNLM